MRARAGWLLVALLAGLTGLTGPAPAGAQQADDPPGRLVVDDLRPRAPQPGDPFQVLGSVTNTGDEVLQDLTVRVRVGRVLDTRTRLAASEADPFPTLFNRGTPQPVTASLAPGRQAPVDLRLDVDALRLTGPGVYPLSIQVRARDADGAPFLVDEDRTFVPWFGGDPVDPLRIAWVLPLVDQPRQAPGGPLVDDELDGLLAPDGRLGRVLASGAQDPTCTAPEPQVPLGEPARPVPAGRQSCTAAPVTYAVDPDLLSTAQVMTAPYAVAPPGDDASERPPSAAAASFLSTLRTAVGSTGTADVLALPYADPDLVALSRNGSGLADQVAAARTLGRQVAADVLQAPAAPSVALPPPGPVSDLVLDALRGDGTRAVVLDETALVPDETATGTPGARAALSATSGRLTGLVVDAGLSSLLTRPGEQDRRLLEQRWLVETAMVAAERPNDGRTLVVALPRRDGPLDPARVSASVTDSGRVPWMCPVRLELVAQGQERCPTSTTPDPAGPGEEPDDGLDRDGTLRASGLDGRSSDDGDRSDGDRSDGDDPLPTALQPLEPDELALPRELRDRVNQFTGAILQGGTPAAAGTRAQLQRALLRTVSSAWRDQSSAGARLTGRLEDELDASFGQVSLRAEPVLLASRDSSLEVAIINELRQPVTVQVRLTAPSSARLSVADPQLVDVAANFALPVSVDAQTQSSGRFVVTAQLLDRDGNPFGPARELRVRSTRYGTLALAVTGVATAVLLVAVGVRLMRRALRGRGTGRGTGSRSSPG